jgi:hypothetical protein
VGRFAHHRFIGMSTSDGAESRQSLFLSLWRVCRWSQSIGLSALSKCRAGSLFRIVVPEYWGLITSVSGAQRFLENPTRALLNRH